MRRASGSSCRSSAFAILLVAGVAVGRRLKLNPPEVVLAPPGRDRRTAPPRRLDARRRAPDLRLHRLVHLRHASDPRSGATRSRTSRCPSTGGRSTTVGAPYNLQWFFDAQDEQRTFDVAYTVSGAAVVGPDVVELYWKWVGDDAPDDRPGRRRASRCRRARASSAPGVTVRSTASCASAQRPRALEPRTSVPQGTFVEGSRRRPRRHRFPALTPTAATPRLPAILAEERAWAASREAGPAAEAADLRSSASGTPATCSSGSAPLVAALGALGFLLAWLALGPRAADAGGHREVLPRPSRRPARGRRRAHALGPAFAPTPSARPCSTSRSAGYLTVAPDVPGRPRDPPRSHRVRVHPSRRSGTGARASCVGSVARARRSPPRNLAVGRRRDGDEESIRCPAGPELARLDRARPPSSSSSAAGLDDDRSPSSVKVRPSEHQTESAASLVERSSRALIGACGRGATSAASDRSPSS